MPQQYGPYEADVVATTVTTPGAPLSLPNPEGVDVIITRMVVDVITKATGAATLALGIAANGTTTSATLLAATAVGGGGAGTPIEGIVGAQKWLAGQFVTGTASATLAGLVARVYLFYHIAKP